jgi:hypothetical protein
MKKGIEILFYFIKSFIINLQYEFSGGNISKFFA